MAWNHMQVEIIPQDALVRPMIGPGGMTRQEAHTQVQQLLDRACGTLAEAAEVWRAGARDDTVYHGPFIWCIYEHPDGEDPRVAAMAWLEDLAETMRAAGGDARVAKLP